MIFLSLGTHEQPFDRALDLAATLAAQGEHVIVQRGLTPIRENSTNTTWHDFLAHDEFQRYLTAARAFVCHAGVGSIVSALAVGRVPVVLPREARYGEHVDNHQLELTEKLAERGLIIRADRLDIGTAIANASAAEIDPLDLDLGSTLRQAVAEAV